jgi:hypothetical protein
MMAQIEPNLPMQLSADKVGAKLPEAVISADAAPTFLPKARPAWQVEINPMDVGQWLLCQRFLDRILVVRPGYDPDLVKAANL